MVINWENEAFSISIIHKFIFWSLDTFFFFLFFLQDSTNRKIYFSLDIYQQFLVHSSFETC